MKTVFRTALVGACLLLGIGATAHAQRGPGGGGGRPGGGMPGGGMSGGGHNPGFPGPMGRPAPGGRDSVRPPAPSGRDGNNSTMRGGLQLGPPGRWWDDKSFAKSIGLRKNQQQKMDAIFNANKASILENYTSLQRAESKLEALTHEPQPDKARIFAGIDAVNMARASLEKANAQMLLQVRQEMDAEQIAKMDKFREPPPAE